jgi:hypothetical protein
MPQHLAYLRPEYPRPDRQRSSLEGYDWINLNGPWQFRFDPDRRGEEEKWFEPGGLEWREQIIVPFCWESLAAWGEADAAGSDHYYSTRVFRNPLEVTRENHRSAERYEVGWYRRPVRVPKNAAWESKRVILTIGAADFFTDCWCNGRHLGHHEGGYTPFEFDLTDALSAPDEAGRREAVIVLRVEDPMDSHEQPVGKQWRWYTSTSGIWQTVFVEPRHASYVRSFRFETDIDAELVRMQMECVEATGASVEVEITPPQGEVMRAILPVQGYLAAGELAIKPMFLWSCNEPHLYYVKLRLRQGSTNLDVVHTYFGMRKVAGTPAEDCKAPAVLCLNNSARYLRGALYQSFYPEGVYTAADVLTIEDDIRCAKQFGFNFLRVHIKVDDPLVLYYADTMGMLLMCDFPNFGEGGDTETGRRRFEQMMRETIARDFNHPSIFAWCIFNETWGFGGQLELLDAIRQPYAKGSAAEQTVKAAKQKLANLSSHAWVRKMWELAKRLDPTRMVEDMSVVNWEHLDYYGHGQTDINSWHFYLHDYEPAREHINKIVASSYVGSGFNYVPGFQNSGEPLINSEYGGVGALDGDRDVSWSFKFLTNELRRHPEISAYIYTELHDVEWEYNGFLNYDRTPKEFGYDPAIINESNVLTIDAPPVRRVRPGDTVSVDVASSHFSTRAHQNVTLEWRLGGVDTRGRLHQDLTQGWAPIPFPHLRVAHAHRIEFQAPELPVLCTLVLNAFNSGGTVVARNFMHLLVSDGYPPRREEISRALVLRAAPNEWSESQWSRGTSSREQQQADDVCYGMGHGRFEWRLPLSTQELQKARRLRVLCEASAHRVDTPQTDDQTFPTTLQMLLNGVSVQQSVLRNHPHDARGVLSYLRGGVGAYGYLIHAFAEGDLLQTILGQATGSALRFTCQVPDTALAQGGLTIYGAEAGRFPVCPTIIVEW